MYIIEILYCIKKCIHLEWRWLFDLCWYILIQTVRFIVLIINIPDEKLFSETAVGAALHTLSKFYDVPVVFVYPLPILRLRIALFAIYEGWLLLNIEWFVLFLDRFVCLVLCYA